MATGAASSRSDGRATPKSQSVTNRKTQVRGRSTRAGVGAEPQAMRWWQQIRGESTRVGTPRMQTWGSAHR